MDDEEIRGTYHGVDSVQRSFRYSVDEKVEGQTSFEVTNRLWEELWNPEIQEPFKAQVESITSAIDRLALM